MSGVQRKFRREPRSQMDFEDTYRQKRGALENINPLCIDFPPDSKFVSIKNFQAQKFIERIEQVLRENQGGSIHFIMPMVGQHATSEFLKGVLHVLSPDKRIPVTSLMTPARNLLNRFEEGKTEPSDIEAERTFRENVLKSIEHHGSQIGKTRFVIIDMEGSGTTQRAFKRIVGDGFTFIELQEFSYAKTDEYHMTKDKTNDGMITVSRGELLEMILKQDPDSPPDERIGPRDLKNRGKILIDSLRESYDLVKYTDKYFTHKEKSAIVRSVAFNEPSDSSSEKKWHPIIEQIRGMPRERQEAIVRKLKSEDIMLSRMAYQYGIACAKDQIRKS